MSHELQRGGQAVAVESRQRAARGGLRSRRRRAFQAKPGGSEKRQNWITFRAPLKAFRRGRAPGARRGSAWDVR